MSSSTIIPCLELTACQAAQKASVRKVNNWCHWFGKRKNRNNHFMTPACPLESDLRVQEMKLGLREKAVRWAARPRDLQTVSADVIYWSQFQVLLWMEREKTSRMMRWSAGTCFALKRLDCFTCASSTSPIQPWQLYGKIIGLLGHCFGQRCSSKCIQRSVI